MKIAIDTMSGDFGPIPIIEGIAQAIDEFNIQVVIIGDPGTLASILKKYPKIKKNIEIYPSSEVISMQESPVLAVRRKKQASVVIAAKKVAEREVFGFFSPGNTGATLTSAIQYLGRLNRVKRPALGIPLPRYDTGITLLIDGGANIDCKPEWLVQFAIMGEVYSREIYGVVNPKIGLLSNGEEDKKGNEQTKKTFAMLKKLPFDFIGNIEGSDLFGNGKIVDVVISDGFIGNIVLKSSEALAKAIFTNLSQSIRKSKIAMAGSLLMKSLLKKLKKKWIMLNMEEFHCLESMGL